MIWWHYIYFGSTAHFLKIEICMYICLLIRNKVFYIIKDVLDVILKMLNANIQIMLCIMS